MKNIRFVILALSIITIAVCGYKMTLLPLWEWWTFPFLLSIWATIVSLFYKKYNPKWLGLSTLSGILLGLGFPNSPLTPLMFIGFVPLLWIEKELTLLAIPSVTKPRKWSFFSKNTQDGILKYAFNAFIIWNLLATWWVTNAGAGIAGNAPNGHRSLLVFIAGLIAGFMANYINSFFMAIPIWLFYRTNKAINPTWIAGNNTLQRVKADEILKYGAFISFWLAFEYLHLSWELSWPWLTLGNAFAQYPTWVQWYEYTGTTGGSLWILILNILIFKLLDKKYFRQENIKANIIQVIAWLVIPLSISFVILSNVKESSDKKVKVVAVQPNLEPHYEKFDMPLVLQMEKFLKLASEKVDSTTDYLIFPETSFDFRYVDTWNQNPTVIELRQFVGKYPHLHLVTGIDAMKIHAAFVNKKSEKMPPSVREYDNRDGTFTYYENYNAATQIMSGSDSLPLYKKSKLVPGAEILPYGQLLAFLKPVFKQFGGVLGGLGTQPERSVFWNTTGENAVAPLICYESIYSDYCTDYVRKGANALFVVTNDGWWGDTPGYLQHQKFASLRAIELRRPVVRSANTGSSCFIDIKGNIRQATQYAKDAVIEDTINLETRQTFFAKTGDILGRLARNIAIGFLIGLFLSLFIKKNKTI